MGDTTSFGGAIYSNGGSLNVNNSNFINITSRGGNLVYGGVIYSENGGSITVTNSNFINTTARGVYTYGGAIYSKGSVTVTKSSFINTKVNGTLMGAGGAIFGSTGSNINVFGSTFINTTALGESGEGGAISGIDVPSNIVVFDSIFKNCQATNGGSDICSDGGVTLLSNDYDGKSTFNSTEVVGNPIIDFNGTFSELQYRIDSTPVNGVLNLVNKKYTANERDTTININKNITINGQ